MNKKIKINSNYSLGDKLKNCFKKVKLKVYINSIMGFYLEKKILALHLYVYLQNEKNKMIENCPQYYRSFFKTFLN